MAESTAPTRSSRAPTLGLVDAERRVDLFAVSGGDLRNLHQAIDKHPQARLRRNTAGRDMRAVEQAHIFEILHDVADGRGRRPFRSCVRVRVREPTGSPVCEIAFDHAAKDLARTVVHLGQQAVGVGHRSLLVARGKCSVGGSVNRGCIDGAQGL